jgi:pimeloyl-ACP methyl ester carboxylesterase
MPIQQRRISFFPSADGTRLAYASSGQGPAVLKACIPEIGFEAEKAWGKAVVMRSNATAAVQILECVEHLDLESRLQTIATPTLILHGRKDVIAPLAASEKLLGYLPNASLVVHDDAGHVPTVTRPEWVAEQINHFFRERATSSLEFVAAQ